MSIVCVQYLLIAWHSFLYVFPSRAHTGPLFLSHFGPVDKYNISFYYTVESCHPHVSYASVLTTHVKNARTLLERDFKLNFD